MKSLPATQETQVLYLGQEDPLEKGMATHSSILAWKFPWTEELGKLLSMGSQRVRHNWVTNAHYFHLILVQLMIELKKFFSIMQTFLLISLFL